MAATVDELAGRAARALTELAETAGPIEEEWQYVADLVAAWSARLTAVGASRSTEPAEPATIAAVDRVIAEAAQVTDPHRAIDWLSTLPQVVLVALGEAG
jgi:hypothetical protein